MNSRQGFVPAESVMDFRKQLGCDTFRTEEKGIRPYLVTQKVWMRSLQHKLYDLFCHHSQTRRSLLLSSFRRCFAWSHCSSSGLMNISPYLSVYRCVSESLSLLRLKGEPAQGTYTFQIFLEKEQVGQVPTVQQLLETSCLSGDLKFEMVSISS